MLSKFMFDLQNWFGIWTVEQLMKSKFHLIYKIDWFDNLGFLLVIRAKNGLNLGSSATYKDEIWVVKVLLVKWMIMCRAVMLL